MKIDLKVRQMKTGESFIATLDNIDDACTWLKDRPEFMEIVTLISQDLSPAQKGRLRDAMRPYDKEELAFQAEAREAEEKAAQERMEAEQAEWERRQKEHIAAELKADPNRVMAIRWHEDIGFKAADQHDPREIPEVTQKAIMAWVEERNGWVAAKGHYVCEAHVEAYLGEVPEGQERITGGQFFARPKEMPKS